MAASLTGTGARLRSDINGLKRTSGFPSWSSSYTVMFKVKVDANRTGDSRYCTFLYLGDDPINLYTQYIWIGQLAGSNNVTLDIAGNLVTSGSALTAGTEYHICYTRSGNTHTLYVGSVSQGTTSKNVSAWTAATEAWLGSDGYRTRVGVAFKQFREYQGSALSSGQITTEAGSSTPVISTNLFTASILSNNATLTDSSGNAHTWARNGNLGSDSGFSGVHVPFNEVDPNGDRTVAFWYKPTSSFSANAPGNQLMWVTEGGEGNYLFITRGASGTPLNATPLVHGTVDETPGASHSFPTNAWRYVVYRRSGDTHQFLFNHVQLGSNITEDWANYDSGEQSLGNNNNGHQTEGIYAYYREWAASLTDNELLEESKSVTAVRTSNLAADIPFTSDALDASANGRAFIATGTVTYTADTPFQSLTGATRAASATLYAPTVGASQNVTNGTINSTVSLFAPSNVSFEIAISLPTISSNTTLYAPTVATSPPLVYIKNVLMVSVNSSDQIFVQVLANSSANATSTATYIDDGSYHDVEVRGSMSSWDIDTESFVADGWYEVWIDDDLVVSNYDILLYSTDLQYINQGVPRATFGEVTVYPQGGEIDCLRYAPFGYGEAPVAVCCNNQGPGGSPVIPPPVGPGLDPPEIVLPPIVIPPGGADPPETYTPCTGGGVPATAVDPTDGESMLGAKTPLIKIDWTLADDTIRREAKLPIHKPGELPYEERIVSFSSLTYALADRQGNLETLNFEFGLNDFDGEIRNILSTGDNQYILGRRVQGWIESDENRRLGLEPFRLFSGVITNYPEITDDLTLNIPVSDELGYRYSPFSFDRQMPFRTLQPEMFPNLPLQNQGLPVPIIYGEMSDESRILDPEPYNIPYGIVPTIFLGARAFAPLAGGSVETWDAYLVCGHAIKSINAWFASNQSSVNPGSVRMAASTAGAGGDFLIPGYANWDLYFNTSYTDLTDSNGVTERYTIIYARGPISDAAVGGTTPITLNVCGIEDVGDGTGDMISDVSYQILHFLAYWVLPEISYRTGVWGGIPTYPTLVPKLSTTSFAEVKAIHDARLAGGYPGAWMLTTQAAVKEILVDLQMGSDLRLGRNHNGQIFASAFDETQDVDDLVEISDEYDVQENSFRWLPRADELENVLPYIYGPEPATGRFTGAKQLMVSATSVVNYLGERRAKDAIITTTRVKEVADDIMFRRLQWSQNTPAYVFFNMNLSALSLRPGQLIRLKHTAGLGLTGWTDRILLVTLLKVQPEETDFYVEVQCEDVDRLFAT